MEELLTFQFVVYELAHEKYALRISDVYEIIRPPKITVVYNSKSYLAGIINLRGKIVPVIDMHRRLGLKEGEISKLRRIIVVRCQDEMVGMMVDKVNQVTQFGEIQATPSTVAGLDGNYFDGIGIDGGSIVGLLKIDKVLYE